MRRILCLLILAIVFLGCSVEEFFPAASPTSIPLSPSKQVIETDLPLREIWRWTGTIDSGPMIVFAEDKLVLASWEYEGHRILVFDAQTGNLLWGSEPIPNLRSLHVDGERVYAGAIKNVQAYDIENGQLLWEGAGQPKFKRGGLAVYPNGEYLEAYDSIEGKLTVLDAQTGETVDIVEQPQTILRKDENYYSRNCVSTYCYFNLSNPSENRLWQNRFDGLPQIWPIFIDDLVYIGTDAGIYAIDIESGDIVWQSKDTYVTNIAAGDGLIYAISEDASIVGLDAKTGQLAGRVEIEPKRTYQDDEDLGYNTYYNIAASDKYLAAYYDNSGELIIFEEKDGDE